MAASTTTAKSSRPARKKPAKSPKSSKSSKSPKAPTVTAEQRRQMIEESAYFRAEGRDFEGGDAVGDWLMSEKEVDDLLSKAAH